MFLTPYLAANSWLASTSSFPTTAFPSYSVLISSIIGPTILQGPHHAAQKSTITGFSLFSTCSSKFASVISIAIIVCFFCYTYFVKLVKYFCFPYTRDIVFGYTLIRHVYLAVTPRS